jgi:hypothetical protein
MMQKSCKNSNWKPLKCIHAMVENEYGITTGLPIGKVSKFEVLWTRHFSSIKFLVFAKFHSRQWWGFIMWFYRLSCVQQITCDSHMECIHHGSLIFFVNYVCLSHAIFFFLVNHGCLDLNEIKAKPCIACILIKNIYHVPYIFLACTLCVYCIP